MTGSATGAVNVSTMPLVVAITREQARHYLTGQLALRRMSARPALAGARALLEKLRCIQLDPLDTIGTNPDLVAMARVDGLGRGDLFRAVYPGRAFEHWAKERCLLPASAFPWYRDQSAETSWWRHEERLRRIPPGVVEKVLDEVRARGPINGAELTDHGAVEAFDWSGWKGTGKAQTMALQVLWTDCRIVVCGRDGNTKLYDVPERALPRFARAVPPHRDFYRWAIAERVEAAGLLARAGGPTWSMLEPARTTGLVDEMIADGVLEAVTIEGSSRPYLAPAGFRRRRFPGYDGLVRILGPLDPLLWDRALVRHVFDFDYVWEVYKPEAQRRWGWYVCPLLQNDRFVGRLQGTVDRALRISRIWREENVALDDDALDAALARHARNCGVTRVVRPRKKRT